MKGVAMSAGRKMLKELYVGFLLLLLSFLYLSHLTREENDILRQEAEMKAKAPATQIVIAKRNV